METAVFISTKTSTGLCKDERWKMDVAVSEGQEWQTKSKDKSFLLIISNISQTYIWHIFMFEDLYTSTIWFQCQ